MDGQVRNSCNWDITLQLTIIRRGKYSRLIPLIFALHSKVSKTPEKKSVLSNLKFLVREIQKVKQTLLRKVSPTDYEQKYLNMMVWEIYTSSFVSFISNIILSYVNDLTFHHHPIFVHFSWI